ncbi:hypothetical protein [Psychroserpens sp. SPM9]|uniref:hypothetical protein n=1 Tax=Psychroserpens sp. SPM9 TaxID=2975598 RepID=UPI0021A94B18|nr:hypothetical protein [Psychroserpens sp. SPM9]MDG5490591.1 hypothetical protein [Psychroserpens sp. SPM9]
MDEDLSLHKELDLIQSVIGRMANNSFLIKGWTMTLMSALIAFGKDSILSNINGIYYLLIMIGVLIPFWWLDSYYLRQERVFRKLYEVVIADPKAKDRTRFNLDPESTEGFIEEKLFSVMFSGSIRWFYIPFALVLILVIGLKIAGIL